MTLLIGIHCTDGIVIAADQQASRGPAGGMPTVGSPVTKISAIKGNGALFAFSGYTGLGQQIGATVEAQLDLNNNYFGQVAALQKSAFSVILPAAQRAQAMGQIIRDSASEAICGCLFAAKFPDGLHLIEVSPQANFDLIDAVKWTCIGGGQANADPFMSFLWNVYWNDRSPNLQEAIMTAYWGVITTIASRTPGVGYDVDVFTLAEHDDTYRTRQLSKAELMEIDNFIGQMKSSMRLFRDKIIPTPQTEAEDTADESPLLQPHFIPNSSRVSNL